MSQKLKKRTRRKGNVLDAETIETLLHSSVLLMFMSDEEYSAKMAELKKLWGQHMRYLMDEWFASNELFTRPWCWWQFTGPHDDVDSHYTAKSVEEYLRKNNLLTEEEKKL